MSGTDNQTITVTYNAVADGTVRSGTITVTASNAPNSPLFFQLQQGTLPDMLVWQTSRQDAIDLAKSEGKKILLLAGRETLEVASSAGTATFGIANTGTGTMDWTISEDADWLSVNPASGTGNQNITVTYDANTGAQRTAVITVTAPGATDSPRTVQVPQGPPVYQPVLSVSPPTLDVASSAGTATFGIANTGTGTMDWTISEDADWLTVSPTSGAGDQTIKVTYDANNNDSARTAMITVTAPETAESPQTIEIRQSFCDANAVFTFTTKGLTAHFDTENSSGKLSFDYGDNTTGTEPEHTYAEAGIYEVTLTVTVSSECVASETRTITISPMLPTVVSANITEPGMTTAPGSGFVLETGGVPLTARGICWSRSPEPTLENNDGMAADMEAGTGQFGLELTGLTPDSTYHVRAYATNEAGTAYGEERIFRTLASEATAGDINDDGNIDLRDAVLVLKVMAGIALHENIRHDTDVNGDGKLGMEEVIYILQMVIGY